MKDEIYKEFKLDAWAKWAKAVNTGSPQLKQVLTTNISTAIPATVKTHNKPAPVFTPTKPKVIVKKSTVASAKTNIIPLQQIEEEVKVCTKCDLSKTRTNTVFARGDGVQNAVMIIGEGPGDDEDKQGIPFVGQAGKLLDQMLHAINLYKKKNVYITNIVKCRPPGNRDPKPEEVATCIGYLESQINYIEPELIITVGLVPTETLLQEKKSMRDYRDKVHQFKDYKVIACYHPSYLLRSPSKKSLAWNDLLFIKRNLTWS